MAIVNISIKFLLDKIIHFSFVLLAVLTPLLFSSHNSELFEVPKMLIVYGISTIVLTSTLLKFVIDKKITLPKGPIVYTFLAFLLAQLVSTIFSIDRFTSIFGYPTRLNGGLISQFAYFVIFVCALINLTKSQSRKLIALYVITALAVSLWGIPGHFGYDPSCWVLTNKLTSTCWQAEFQPTLRIFSTLGQPNWLASYLVLVFPLSLVLFFQNKAAVPRIVYAISSLAIFGALIFTNSRSGIAGAVLAIIILTILLGKSFLTRNKKVVLPSVIILALVCIFFGSTLLGRIGETITGRAVGGTETSRIRTIVWQGALDIFKSHLLIGTGPETFAFSYQKQRPLEHNNTTEWDFFYNKAHNEFLNYLANIGIVGTLLYLSLLYLILTSIHRISKAEDKTTVLVAKAAMAGIIGYQLTIFFGFSVVATQTLMYLLAALVLILGNPTFKQLKLNISRFKSLAIITVILISGLWLLVSSIRLYLADIFIERAKSQVSASKSTLAFNNALLTFGTKNPYYLADFASNSAIFTANFEDEELTADFAITADESARQSYKISPNNFLNIRKLINVYILIGNLDEKYKNEGEILTAKLKELAPNDPQTYYTIAKFDLANNKKAEAVKELNHALKLKPDYVAAAQLLEQVQTIDNSAPRTEN